MGDMSRCKHDDFIGYCKICNPPWETDMIADQLKCDIEDQRYTRLKDWKEQVEKALNKSW